MQFFSLAELSL